MGQFLESKFRPEDEQMPSFHLGKSPNHGYSLKSSLVNQPNPAIFDLN